MLGSLTSFQLVTNTLQFQRQALQQKANAVPNEISIIVEKDSIQFGNLGRRTWSEMVNKVSLLGRSPANSSGMTVKAILQALKDYCMDGKRSN